MLIGVSANIYNHCIALHKRYYKLYNRHLNKFKLQKHITKLKKRNYKYWNLLGSQAIQNITDRIELSYQAFFSHIKQKKGGKKGLPKFKARAKYKSFTFKGDVGYSIKNNIITINSIKKSFKFSKSRAYGKKIKTLTIKRNRLGEYFIFLSCELEADKSKKSKPMTGKSAGFDFGLKMFLTSSDNEEMQSPLFYKSNLKKLKKANKNLSSKKKGSNNRKKAKINLARVHRDISYKREAFHWSLANELLNKYDVLFFEDLHIKAMQMLWGRKVSDIGFHSFMSKLKYLAEIHNKNVIQIDKYYPSSKTCSDCGNVKKKLEIKERIFDCEKCKLSIDRDLNASINIKKVGVSTFARETVNPTLAVG